MRLRITSHLAVAAALVAAPVAASAAPAVNPAASLSLSHSARVGSPSGHDSALAGGVGIFGIVIGLGVIAIIVVAAVNDDDNGRPNSP